MTAWPDQSLLALAALCRPPVPGDSAWVPVTLPPLDRLFRSALDHDVMGLAAAALLAGRGGPLTGEVREGLSIYRDGVRLGVVRAETQLAELLGRFSERGLPVMPFKGPLLGRQAFGDGMGRPCRDLDLLIRSDDVDAALACLADAGFVHQHGLDDDGLAAIRRYAGEYIMFREGSLPVEPHWHPAPRTMAFEIDIDAIWRRAEPGFFAGAPCHLPAPEDHLFLLLLHGTKEQWHKLKWLADVAAFLARHPALDLPALRSTAAAQGCGRMVDLGLRLSHRLFAVPAMAPIADAVTMELADAVAVQLADTTAPSDGPYVVTSFHWRVRERLRDRSRYAVRTLLTPRVAHYRRLPLPPALRWLHVPLKLPWDHILTPLIRAARRLYHRRARLHPPRP